jgi:ABC-2 type transport system permease protein
VRLYYEVAKRAFARQTAYRAANLAGLTTNAFFGAMRSYLFIALYAGSTVVAGWTLDDAVAFVWIAQALIMPRYIWGWQEIALTIRSGDVISDLSKPFDYYSFWLAQDAGRAVYHTIFRAVPTLTVGMVLFDVRLTTDPVTWSSFLVSLAGAVWISFGLRFITNIACFWLLDYRGVIIALMFASSFFSGLLVPLNYWPEWAQALVVWLPFAGMVQAPADVLLGQAQGQELAGLLLFQFSWGVALLLAGRLLLAQAVRKVVVQGG